MRSSSRPWVETCCKYSPSLLRARSSAPKLIVHDNALLRAFERPIDLTLSPNQLGLYLENAVGARFLEAGWDTWYWRDRDLEADYVVIGPRNERWAVEVKTSPTSRPELRGVLEFCRRYPDFEPCLVSLAGQELEGVRSLPVETVLSLAGLR